MLTSLWLIQFRMENDYSLNPENPCVFQVVLQTFALYISWTLEQVAEL